MKEQPNTMTKMNHLLIAECRRSFPVQKQPSFVYNWLIHFLLQTECFLVWHKASFLPSRVWGPNWQRLMYSSHYKWRHIEMQKDWSLNIFICSKFTFFFPKSHLKQLQKLSQMHRYRFLKLRCWHLTNTFSLWNQLCNSQYCLKYVFGSSIPDSGKNRTRCFSLLVIRKHLSKFKRGRSTFYFIVNNTKR